MSKLFDHKHNHYECNDFICLKLQTTQFITRCLIYQKKSPIISNVCALEKPCYWSLKIMSRFASLFAFILLLTACETPQQTAQFWRPIANPNIALNLNDAQVKLEYDLSQCHCGIFPRTVPQSVKSIVTTDRQRLNQTSVNAVDVGDGQCVEKPSLVVGECMRARGWEVTNCSGRMPVAGGGAVCAGYQVQ
jgi:hypothetical protein